MDIHGYPWIAMDSHGHIQDVEVQGRDWESKSWMISQNMDFNIHIQHSDVQLLDSKGQVLGQSRFRTSKSWIIAARRGCG